MNRRGFLTAAAVAIVVPQFGRFYREGAGTLWRPEVRTFWDIGVARPVPAGVGVRMTNGYLPLSASTTYEVVSIGPATEAEARLIAARIIPGFYWERHLPSIFRRPE